MKIKQQLKQVWFNTLMKNFKLNWKVKEWVGGCVFVQCEHSVRYVKTEHEVWSRSGLKFGCMTQFPSCADL